MTNNVDYYEILGIDSSATEDEIASAYRKTARKYHPEHNPENKEAIEKFKLATEAYEVLKDKERREAYDLKRAAYRSKGNYKKRCPQCGAEVNGPICLRCGSIVDSVYTTGWSDGKSANPFHTGDFQASQNADFRKGNYWRYCPQCGSEVNGRFCFRCGAEVDAGYTTGRYARNNGNPYQAGSQTSQNADIESGSDVPEIPSFIQAFPMVMKKYAKFSGRASRPEFWYFWLTCILVNFVFSMIVQLVGPESAVTNIVAIVQGLFSLAVVIPQIACGVRRLHDTNRTGWWCRLLLVPVIGWIYLLIWLVGVPTPGPNKYGPQPWKRR